ncbi:hypothetical protein [Phycicoccus sp.]|uniref:hypothetical protein n=1 Tax=Phycicoccus sp. TaxID=1902410 RepID=UPI002C3083AC|nr:hypothetical protein [Phycicoccus sp.]HMM93966.1 hypothetical protein [Phycicoccus sp.]
MTATTNPVPPEDAPLYRTSLGYRLDLRHRFAWRMADFARWLLGEADALQRRAHALSRGEIAPTLPLLTSQFFDVAEAIGMRSSELAAMVDTERLNEGRDRRMAGR